MKAAETASWGLANLNEEFRFEKVEDNVAELLIRHLFTFLSVPLLSPLSLIACLWCVQDKDLLRG
jgi:hypothetical protein